MDATVIVGTFGDQEWVALAHERAIPSAETQDVPVIHVHGEPQETYGASLAVCRNAAAEQATSEWLCFLDADDELQPGFFDAMEHASADLRTPQVQYVRRRRVHAPMFWPEGDLRDGNHLIVSTLIRRDLFFEVGAFRDVLLYEDWDLWQRCWKAGASIEQVPGAVCRVHINPASKHRYGTTREEKAAAHEQVRRLNFPELYEVEELAEAA